MLIKLHTRTGSIGTLYNMMIGILGAFEEKNYHLKTKYCILYNGKP